MQKLLFQCAATPSRLVSGKCSLMLCPPKLKGDGKHGAFAPYPIIGKENALAY